MNQLLVVQEVSQPCQTLRYRLLYRPYEPANIAKYMTDASLAHSVWCENIHKGRVLQTRHPPTRVRRTHAVFRRGPLPRLRSRAVTQLEPS
jgi:hypothetical protein